MGGMGRARRHFRWLLKYSGCFTDPCNMRWSCRTPVMFLRSEKVSSTTCSATNFSLNCALIEIKPFILSSIVVRNVKKIFYSVKRLRYLSSGLKKNLVGFFPMNFISQRSSVGTLYLADTKMSRLLFILKPELGSSKYSMVIFSGASWPRHSMRACRIFSISLNSNFKFFVVFILKNGTALLLIPFNVLIYTFILSVAYPITFAH